MMKRIVCFLIAAAMLASACLVLTGCGEDKKDNTKATTAPTQAATQAETQPSAQAETQAEATSAPVEQPTEAQQQIEPQDDNSDLYGGITSAEAADMALDFAGDGYEVVSAEQRYLRNQEAWYVGVKAFTEDSTVYYMYVKEGEVTPVSEIPDRSNGQSGLWGDIDLDTAVQYAISYLGDGYRVIGSEQSEFNNTEVWWINAESDDGDTRFLYVNANGVIGEAV